jgi:hypothetical protein
LTPLNAPGPVREKGAISRAAAIACSDAQREGRRGWLGYPGARMHQIHRIGVGGVMAGVHLPVAHVGAVVAGAYDDNDIQLADQLVQALGDQPDMRPGVRVRVVY